MFKQTYLILTLFLPKALDCYKDNMPFYFNIAFIMSAFYLLIIISPLSNMVFLLTAHLFFAGMELGIIKITFDFTKPSNKNDTKKKAQASVLKELFSYYYLLPFWLAGNLLKTTLILACFVPWFLMTDNMVLSMDTIEPAFIDQALPNHSTSMFFLFGIIVSMGIISKMYFFDFLLVQTGHAVHSILFSIQMSAGRSAAIMLLFIIYYIFFITITALSALLLGPLSLLLGMTVKQIGIIFTCLWYQEIANNKQAI